MKKIYLAFVAIMCQYVLIGQAITDARIEPEYGSPIVIANQDVLKTQVVFVGGVSEVQTTATYGNESGVALAKEWHDFIGMTPDTTGESLGWVSVNHEMIQANDNIGDGGGMTTFRIARDPETDSLIVLEQTLEDGRSGKFFNVDFVNTVGETGMNCGGINSFDGRIWTAEEWFRSNTGSIYGGGEGVRDTTEFTISSDIPGDFDGAVIPKYQNFNWMVEIDPIQAKAIRKQYNWGRQPFEGGAILPDNQTVFMGADDTPGFFTKFVADEPGDFTKGKTYVFKEDSEEKWIEIDNTSLEKMLNFPAEAIAVGATMYNRLEWVVADKSSGMIYLAETGRDSPGSRWSGEAEAGATFASHTLVRAAEKFSGDPLASDYKDYYGRVLRFDPSTNEMISFLEGGPDIGSTEDATICTYPSVHLSNPDGLHVMTVGGKSYLVIQEDLNGDSFGRVPGEFKHFRMRTCELFILDLSIESPTLDDLVRLAIVPAGAEVTGAVSTPDGKTLLFNSQHPSTDNPFPFNHSMTIALHGFDQLLETTASKELEHEEFINGEKVKIRPNPASQYVEFNKPLDVTIFNANGAKLREYQNIQMIQTGDLPKGIYFLHFSNRVVKKLIIN